MRILPAAQYDALKAAADKEGGVGTGQMLDGECGVCGYGLGYVAGIVQVPDEDKADQSDLDEALYKQSEIGALPFAWEDSDDATWVVRDRLGLDGWERVPFDDWADEIGLIRGE